MDVDANVGSSGGRILYMYKIQRSGSTAAQMEKFSIHKLVVMIMLASVRLTESKLEN